MATLTIDAITLPPDLVWADELNWTPIKAQQEYSLGGTLVIQEAESLAGRPITLVSGEDFAWVQRFNVLALLAKASTLNNPTMLLTLGDGRAYNVKFDRSADDPVKAEALLPGKGPVGTDYYKITLKLIQV